ncbi:MFS transporter [Sphingobium lignivorans]|uniref:MFS family permease n=1 Tax=Sphingobium lignivorans TaxID=2735886 RepID=A0ABR6NDA4_9SPHN|nr:MFS transporter [Sphingobium lignivorans]MBB5985248.1 MFS family permease [Sphingobium lignivorans]
MAIAPVTGQGAPKEGTQAHSWPSAPAAYYGLTVIIIATFLSFFDSTVFGMLAERIKIDFGLSDTQLGILGGPASIIFYVFVGIPLARLVDLYPRRIILAISAAVTGGVTMLSGLAQNFGQFIAARMLLGAGGSAHAPGSYSLIVDMFRPKRIPISFALLQLGFIGGTTLGVFFGGMMIAATSHWEPSQVMGLRIFGWQWILIGLGLLSFPAALLFLFIKEPGRRLAPVEAVVVPEAVPLGRKVLTFMGFDALKGIRAKGVVYYPLFFALALSATESQGIGFWRVPFLVRTYGLDEARIGQVLAPMLLVAQLVGLVLGGVMVSWFARRHKDANVRTAAICFTAVTVCTLAAPLMPSGELAMGAMAIATMFGLAGAPAQNAAIQRVAPQAMRGQVTAFYLFMFTFFGAMGSFVIGAVAQYVVGDEARLWQAIFITALVLLPLATISMWRACKPYRAEIERLEAAEAAIAAQTTETAKGS